MKKNLRHFLFIIAITTAAVVGFNVCYANFLPAVSYGVGSNPRSVFAADLDGDGDGDLAVANYGSNSVSILLNNGNSTFAATVNYAVGSNPASVFAADLDGDLDFDLAVTNFVSDNVSILLNNGDGAFAAAVNYASGDGAWSVFAADLDGDGDRDLAVTNSNVTTVSILLNNGNATFAAAVNYNVQNVPSSVFAVDLDGDGDNDLAVANYFSASISILLNNGNGTFAAAVNYSIVTYPIFLFAADLDGDGDYDLATANYDDANTSVLLNNGNGTFAAAVNYNVGNQPPSVFAADFDGDGDYDLAVANYSSDNVSILLNNGDGTFAAAVNYGAGDGAWSVFAADLDGDGDNDLAVANYNSGSVSIILSTVNNPVPTTASISPGAKNVGDPGFAMTVDGTGFVTGSIVRLDGSDRATTFVSSTRLTAVFLSSDMASAGTFDVTVFSPTPGGGTSAAQIFTVNNNPTSGGGGLPAEAYNPPTPPPGGFGILINSGAPETNSQNVVLTLKGGPDTARMAISNNLEFSGMGSTGQIPYQSAYDWDICNGQIECPEGVHTVYVKFYTRWGRTSDTIQDSITLETRIHETEPSPEQKPSPCEPTIYLTNSIKYGASNKPEDVKLLEQFLNIYEGYNLPIDGFYSLEDKNAVIEWQEKYHQDILAPWGLSKGTGYVYTTSLAKIKQIVLEKSCKPDTEQVFTDTYVFTRNLSNGMTGEDVKELQKFLNNNGFKLANSGPGSPGNETTMFGALTRQALIKFQQAHNINPAVGYFGPITRGVINSLN